MASAAAWETCSNQLLTMNGYASLTHQERTVAAERLKVQEPPRERLQRGELDKFNIHTPGSNGYDTCI